MQARRCPTKRNAKENNALAEDGVALALADKVGMWHFEGAGADLVPLLERHLLQSANVLAGACARAGE